jgi:hypothetical protein
MLQFVTLSPFVFLGILGLWIAVVVWLALTKRSRSLRVAVLAVTGTFTLCVTFALWILAIHISSSDRASSPTSVWQDHRLVVDAAGEQTFDFDLEKPCSLQVDALEVHGKNIEFRVLQNGRTVYQSGAESAKVRGRIPVEDGVATVAVVNGDAHESKTVNLTVAELPR